MMYVQATAKWTPGAMEKIKKYPDKVMYEIARRTLDMTEAHIPMNTGALRGSSMSKGVRGKKGDYYIGSYMDYAKHVWDLKHVKHWTTPGTFARWYAVVWQDKRDSIIQQTLERNKLK